MLESRRCGEGVPIPGAVGNLVPIGGVKLSPRCVVSRDDPLARFGDQAQHHDCHHQEHHHRRQQAAQTTSPETDQVQAVVVDEFVDDQRGDEESREGEKQVDTEKAPTQSIVVEGQNPDHRESPQTIEPPKAFAIGARVTHVIIVGLLSFDHQQGASATTRLRHAWSPVRRGDSRVRPW